MLVPAGRLIATGAGTWRRGLNRERRASGASERREFAAVKKKIATMIAAIEDGG